MEENNKTEVLEVLHVDLISYSDFIENKSHALATLKKALFETGIVGIKGIPGYKEKLARYIESAKDFASLPEAIKELYAPNHALGEMFLGYEKGKEKFKRPDGKWVVDDLKTSYYGFVPDSPSNKWPREMDLKTPFQDIGSLMSEVAEAIMKKIDLLGPQSGICIDDTPRVGRMLYYRKNIENTDNPFWCGAHFDHGIFTALLPAVYFVDGEEVPEPFEAGLFVRTQTDGIFKKVVVDEPDAMLFQVGEFGQLITNDAIMATEHRVHKTSKPIERYTMALFFSAPKETVIYSHSELTADARYGGTSGDPCSYGRWEEESFKRYNVKDKP